MQNELQLYERVEFSDSFREFIKNHKYEAYVLSIIEKSVTFFAGKSFYPVKNQAHGEPDFYDNTGEKYEVKLLIDSSQGELLGEKKNDIRRWFNNVNSIANEYAELVQSGNMANIQSLSLYKTMKARIESVNKDEIAILFMPFSIVLDNKHSIFVQFTLDVIQAVYNQLDKDGVVDGRDVFFIYPSTDKGEYVLRDSNYHREYIRVPELDELVIFDTYI